MYEASKLFTQQFPWLGCFPSQKLSTNNPQFHYFTGEQYGYKKVRLFIQDKSDLVGIDMYYQKITNDILTQPVKQRPVENILDLSHLEGYLSERRQVVTTTEIKDKSMWVQKYHPHKFYQLLTEDYLNRTVLAWVKSWDKIVFNKEKPVMKEQKKFQFIGAKNSNINKNPNNPTEENEQQLNQNKLILLAGPPGCGKTTLARVVAAHAGYRTIEINASDDRSAKALILRLENMTKNQTINSDNKPTFIIIDQVDGALQSDNNGIKDVLHYIQTGQMPGQQKRKQLGNNNGKKKQENLFIRRPVLFICNDPYVKGLKELRKKATVLYFQKIRKQKLFQMLKNICAREKLYIQNQALYQICEINDNDIRSTLSMLEFVAKSKSASSLTVSEIISKIKWENKQTTATVSSFVEEILCHKPKSKSLQIAKYNRKLSELEGNSNLVLESYFLNYRNSKAIYHKNAFLTEVLDTITYAEVILNNAFEYKYQLSSFLVLPYIYFKMNLRSDEYLKIEYPMGYFDRITREKQNRQIVQRIKDNFDIEAKPFISNINLIIDYIPALFYVIQSGTNNDKQILSCLKTMVRYGIQFSNLPGGLYQPEIQKLLTYNKRPPMILLSNVSKSLMMSHYKEVNQGHVEMDEDAGIKILEFAKKKKRDLVGVKYKFLEGTGTEIKYELKMSYFFA